MADRPLCIDGHLAHVDPRRSEKDADTCTYSPGGNGGSVPAAGFIAQDAVLCEDDFPKKAGYSDSVDGIGADGFLKTGGGATAEIWVCADDPFTVFVDTGDSNTAAGVAAAEKLAKAAVAAG